MLEEFIDDDAAVFFSAHQLQEEIHKNNKEAGWWLDPSTGKSIRANPLCFSNKVMLVVTELAEAIEADRKDLMDDKLPHRHGREVEVADAIIRLFDLAGGFNMDIGGAILEKLEFNKNRSDHKITNRLAEGGKTY